MNWPIVILRDICKTQYGYTASASEIEIGPKFLRITDIVRDQIDWDSVPYCEIDESQIDNYRLYQGDIVIARTGNTTGYAKLIRDDVKAIFASYLVRLKLDRTVADPAYVGRLIESDIYKAFAVKIKGGAAQGNANAKMLTLFEFRLPSLPTQRRIASILSAYDDLIENNRRRIQLLEQSARLLYREWFVHLRFPGHEHVRIIDEVPEGWEKRYLVDLADLVMGQSPKSEFYNEEGEGLPFHQGVTNFGDRFVNHEIYCTIINRLANPGDILCSVRAPVGRLNITLDQIVIGRGLAAIRSKSGHQSFLYYQLKNHFFKEDMIGGGAIFAAVTKKDMENQELMCPPDSLIKDFEEISMPIDNQLRTLHLQNNRLREARDLLLPHLMNGEITV
jgi:type I restriction enzyme S subunit